MNRQAAKTKTHPDGGTYTELAFAQTRNHWGVSITRWTTYRHQTIFEVHRVNSENKTLRLAYFTSEKQARIFANKIYFGDK